MKKRGQTNSSQGRGSIAFRHGGGYNPKPASDYVGDPNGTRTNCGFLDGHAETMKPSDYYYTSNGHMQIFYSGWKQ